ncbi:MAG: chemotaxis protein CheW [Lysobacterales bacterium]|jgi:chemosensory pili system protein ChpC
MAEKEIRCILAPLTNGQLLLPNSAIAEVMAFTQPEPFRQGPPWLLGEMAWQGWQVPIICFEQVADKGQRSAVTPRSRILVVKTLGGSTQVNYIGLLIQGLPRLTRVTPEALEEQQAEDLPDVLFSKVGIDDQEALIPELGELTLVVEQAAYGG